MQFSKRSEVSTVRWLVAGVLVATGLAVGYLLATQQLGGEARAKSLLQAPEATELVVKDEQLEEHSLLVFSYETRAENRLSFDDARAHCLSLGFELAPVKSVAVAAAIHELSSMTWIGLKDLKPDSADLKDDWAFVDGVTQYDKATFPWQDGQPSGAQHLCAAIWIQGKVYDSDCISGIGFVCESVSKTWVVSMLYMDTFVAVSARGYGYNGAQAFCERMGSHLAVIETQAENQLISAQLRNLDVHSAWIGLSHAVDNKWKTLDGKDPEPLWAAGEETGAEPKSRAVLDSGLEMWRKEDYHSSYVPGFVCEGFEWALVSEVTAISWTDANQFCLDTYGSALSTVRDSATNNEMAARLLQTGASAFIGLSDAEEGEWRWVDESPKTFMDWGPWLLSPGTDENAEDCAVLHGDGKWQDVACDTSAGVSKFFCSVVAKDNRGPECWCKDLPAIGGTLVAVDRAMTWNASQHYCEEHGLGHLASIHNLPQNEEAKVCMADCGLSSYGWIGLSQSVAADYQWSDGSLFDEDAFHNWATDNPVAFEHVLMDVATGKWENVAGAVHNYGFICNKEVPQIPQ